LQKNFQNNPKGKENILSLQRVILIRGEEGGLGRDIYYRIPHRREGEKRTSSKKNIKRKEHKWA